MKTLTWTLCTALTLLGCRSADMLTQTTVSSGAGGDDTTSAGNSGTDQASSSGAGGDGGSGGSNNNSSSSSTAASSSSGGSGGSGGSFCSPGMTQCNGTIVETCNSQGTEWEASDTCPFVCSSGTCVGTCTAGSSQCNGLVVETCDTAGTWHTTSSCLFVCSSGACSGACTPGLGQCNGLVPQTCDSNGQWADGQACSFTCSQGNCEGACTPTDIQCNGRTIQTCDSSGAWQNTQTCPYVCSSGSCTGVCTPGAQQCSGNTPQTCNAQGQWTSAGTCPFLCQAGACSGVCTPGDKKCSGTSTQTCDANAQWAAPVACSAPSHSTASCSGAGVCDWNCSSGFQDCDGNPTNGCEADLSSTTTCGTCGNACSNVNGTATCSSGSCGITCDSGFANCNGGAGCETTLGTTTNCLSCGNSCSAPANAVALCGPSGCDFTCSGAFEDCDGNVGNGCEADTSSSLTNCGGCGITCVGIGAACVAGECSGAIKVTDASNITSLALGTPFAVNDVYWTTSSGTVEKAPSDGGTSTVLASGQNAPEAIQMTGPSLIWSNSTAPQAIRSMPIGGGSTTDLVTGYGPVEMTNDGTNLYFTTRTAYDPCYCTDSSNTSIYKLGMSGGAPTIINTWTNSTVWPGWPGLVVTGNYVQRIQWATSNAVSTVIGQNKTNPADYFGGGGGGVYIGATFESFFSGRFLVKNDLDDMVMWTTLQVSGTALVRMRSGQSPSLIALTAGLTVRAIAADDTDVYVVGRFGATSDDRLIRYPLTGGAATYLLDSFYNAANIHVDDTHVYFSIEGTRLGSGAPTVAPMIVRYEK